ncbi:MAG: hypothetical protein DI586_03320 [Micavibrio aeruginosavorus]|uniref:Type IV secretion protein IcmL n=1 Tax=Micavibrio aeruginosavorus TaxID=349221 RepID=A0A2W5HLI0_9BACT|nr:MAG: hypothetical protein DI586_03320 [Micavibrio aeruginosavorus]
MISSIRAANILILLMAFSFSALAQENPIPTKAPFQTDAATPASNGSKLMGMYDVERQEDVVPMDKPHRTSEQVATWVEESIATALNIQNGWDEQQKKAAPLFDSYGIQEYKKYLDTSGILNNLSAHNLQLNSIADSASVLLSEGALSGTYHWLYQMPVMLTYYDRGTKTLKNNKLRVQNQKIMVRVQVGRVAKARDDTGIVIERWSVLPLR